MLFIVLICKCFVENFHSEANNYIKKTHIFIASTERKTIYFFYFTKNNFLARKIQSVHVKIVYLKKYVIFADMLPTYILIFRSIKICTEQIVEKLR